MIFRLSKRLAFPNPYLGDPDGLLAIGGDLRPERLLLAYEHGIFPWYAYDSEFGPKWYCPLQRFVILPPEIHISHSMRTLMNSGRYTLSMNEAFGDVIRWCGKVDGRNKEEGAWLGEEIIDAYSKLHDLGYAMSVEVWEAQRLVGGLYGVCINQSFIGESMFSLVPSGSKLALIHLAKMLRALPYSMIDCQLETPHLNSMGGRHISYEDYMDLLTMKKSTLEIQTKISAANEPREAEKG